MRLRFFCFSPCLRGETPPPPPATAAPALTPGSLTPEQAEALRSALNLPPGTKVEVEIEAVQGGHSRTIEQGTGVGAGARAEGDKLSDSFTGAAPTVGLGAGRSASGGSAERDTSASALKLPSVAWANPLSRVGLACLLGAGVAIYLGLKRAALICGLSGAGLICAATWPVIMLLAVGAAALVLAGPYVYTEWQNWRHREALRAVVGGVGDPSLPAGTAEAVKQKIALQATAADKATISKIKAADNIQ